MAWNRPSTEQQPTRKNAIKAPSAKRGVIVGAAIVVALGALCVWLFSGGETRQDVASTKKEHGRIKEVTPAAAPKAAAKAEQVAESDQERWKREGHPRNPWGTPIPKDLEYKPHWLYTTEDYCRIDPGYKRRHERFLARQAKIPWQHKCESEIARIIFTKPGDPILDMPIDADFNDQFLESLKTPIIVSKDDDAETAEQKRQMNEVKIYLKDRLDAGENLADVLTAERKYIAELNGFRENLENELRELEKTAKSEDEIDDFVKAANMMLKERGIGKTHLPISETRLRLRREAEERGEPVKDLTQEDSDDVI